jgi:hypothetical protein
MITLKISMKKGKASKQMCHYICSPRFLGLVLKATKSEDGVSFHRQK